MASGKKSNKQLKKMKKNQAKQKAAVQAEQAHEESCRTLETDFKNMVGRTLSAQKAEFENPSLANPVPLEEFHVRDSSGKLYFTRSPAIKMMISNQRPINKNSDGDFMFEYPGFAPFKTYLSCVYVLMDAGMDTSYLYDGNGHTMPIIVSHACLLCKNCDYVRHRPLSKTNGDQIVEVEMCDGHVHELLTLNGFSLPTKRDHASVEKYQTKTHLPNKGPVGLSQENNEELYRVQKQYLADDDKVDWDNIKIDADEPPREMTIYDDVE